jgi:signal transduction histidine kinase/DNA-binding response OmpR family regulator
MGSVNSMHDRVEPANGHRILHLEDDPADRELIREALGTEGITLEVDQVDTRDEFQAALVQEGVVLVLSDFALPTFDGLSALEIVQKQRPNLPFIFVSGTMGEEAAIESLRRGATDYVLKQRLSRLGPAVRRALDEVAARRKRLEAAEAAEKQRAVGALNNDVSLAVSQALSLRGMLQMCTESMVRNLDAAFARIWTLNAIGDVLLLQASTGLYTHLDGPHSRVPVGKFKIGLIAQERQPHLTNDVLNDPRVGDPDWARREGMVAFAGYPLVVGGRLVGVMSMFSKRVLAQSVLDALGGVARTIAMGIERWRLEEQLRQSQKMEAIGQLAGGVAHDFNNLLTIVSGYSQLLLSQDDLSAATRDKIHEIGQAGERAASLTRQLLAFGRKQVLEPEVLDLNAVVTGTEKMLRHTIGEDIDLGTALDPALARVTADPGQIEQIILNLAVNARDAMPQGGKLTIETANVDLDESYASAHAAVSPGSYVMLAVSDTGCGMTPEVTNRVFEPFFTTKGPGKGTGLGLATVYGIVQQSGGHIGLYSEPGHGTSFKVYLPKTEAEASSRRSRQDTRGLPTGSETVLLVEDDDSVRALSRGVLEMSGYTVLEANGAAAALRICEQHTGSIQIVVTDVVMPETGGRILVERLGAMRPALKALYVSGYTDDTVIRHGVLEEGTAFLQKPFTPAGLANKVREVLDQPSAPQSTTTR